MSELTRQIVLDFFSKNFPKKKALDIFDDYNLYEAPTLTQAVIKAIYDGSETYNGNTSPNILATKFQLNIFIVENNKITYYGDLPCNKYLKNILIQKENNKYYNLFSKHNKLYPPSSVALLGKYVINDFSLAEDELKLIEMVDFTKMKKDELTKYAITNGIDISDCKLKQDIIEKINRA